MLHKRIRNATQIHLDWRDDSLPEWTCNSEHSWRPSAGASASAAKRRTSPRRNWLSGLWAKEAVGAPVAGLATWGTPVTGGKPAKNWDFDALTLLGPPEQLPAIAHR